MINASDDPLLAPFRFRSIGPASMGGRIDDVEVAPSDPNIIYVGYAVGGVWKSENNGTTWDPVFDTYSSASIGDIAIHPTNPNIVYVGTGEANNRQTSSFGDGIYKTTDGGKTFQHIGLRETQTIARVVIDPRNPETVYVAALGHLFGPNPERGVYKTTDGGKTWNNVKFIDNDTGFTDIAIDPVEPEHPLRRELPAPAHRLLLQRRRTGQRAVEDDRRRQDLDEDAGKGLPGGTYGRIALDVSRSNPERRLRADRGGPGRPAADDAAYRSGRRDRSDANAAGRAAAAAGDAAGTGRRTDAGGAAAARSARHDAGSAPRRRSRRAAARGGYDWCNNGGPDRGFGRGRAAARRRSRPAGRTTDAATARSIPRRHLPLRGQRRDLDAREQLQLAADVLQSDSRGSHQRQDGLRRRPALGEVARRRQDVPDARQRGRKQLAGPRRPARAVDRPEEPEAPHHRQRRRDQHHLGSGQDLGLREHDGDRAALLGQRRHASAVLRLHRPAGQRQLGRPERDPHRPRHPQLRLVRHWRRRRLPDRRRSHRSQHRLYRVAERQHQPLRPADRPTAEHPAARHRRGGRGGAVAVAADAAAPRSRRRC